MGYYDEKYKCINLKFGRCFSNVLTRKNLYSTLVVLDVVDLGLVAGIAEDCLIGGR